MSHPLGPLSHFGPSTPSTGMLAGFIDLFFPRKSRQRATVLCLFSLVVLTTYVCLVSPPALVPGHPPHPPHHHHGAEDAWRQLVDNLPRPPPGSFHKHRPEIVLSPEQELGAVTAFMAALPQNVIPTDIDPTQPIDPQLVLDFDTRSPRAEEEVANVISDVWLRNPVVVFSKTVSPVSRELKSILDALNVTPYPTIFGVDLRADADVLVPLLFRLTDTSELPILLVGGKPVGSMDTIRELHTNGQLKALVTHAGAVLDDSKKRRKGRR
jgi:glutaredoxin-related protein